MPLPFAAFFGSALQIERVYAQSRRERVLEATRVYPSIVTPENFAEHAPALADLEVIFSTWGMPALTQEQLEKLPNLRAVFYAAGSVQNFARPFLERDILVVSAWAANAVPVAEFALAQILLANKSYFRNARELVAPVRPKTNGRGNFGATVALLGAGQIGRLVIELLKPFELQIIVFDPFLTDESAQVCGVEKVSLEAAFARGNVVSNHLANLPATVGLLNGQLFRAMPQDATFINTGRGATVNEAEMIAVLQARPDLTALLDVTNPEPPVADSPLFQMPNVFLSSHIAGSIGDEVVRMADYVLEEFAAWKRGEPLRFAVTLEMLGTMA